MSASIVKRPEAPCIWCDAGAAKMEGVTLAHMPPGWKAGACLRGWWGHIQPTIPNPSRALPSPAGLHVWGEK